MGKNNWRIWTIDLTHLGAIKNAKMFEQRIDCFAGKLYDPKPADDIRGGCTVSVFADNACKAIRVARNEMRRWKEIKNERY